MKILLSSMSAAAVLLAACTSSGRPSHSVDPGSGMSQSRAQAALLTDTEVGSGLRLAKSAVTRTPFPCTPKIGPLEQRLPPRVQTEATFADSGNDLVFSEKIENYGDAATVAKALALGEQGLKCTSGTIGHLKVAVQGPVDLSKSITTKTAKVEAWAITAQAAKQSIIIAEVGVHLVVLSFGATAGALTTGEDAAGITQRALQKAAAAAG